MHLHLFVDLDWALIFSIVLNRYRPGSQCKIGKDPRLKTYAAKLQHQPSKGWLRAPPHEKRYGMDWNGTVLCHTLWLLFRSLICLEYFGIRFLRFFEIFKGNWIGLRLCLNADETCPAKFSHVVTLILSIHITSGSSVKNIGAESEVMACTERKIRIQRCDKVLWLWIPCEFHVATCCNRTKQWSFGECSGVPLSFCGNDACTNRGRIWCCQSVPHCTILCSIYSTIYD